MVPQLPARQLQAILLLPGTVDSQSNNNLFLLAQLAEEQSWHLLDGGQ